LWIYKNYESNCIRKVRGTEHLIEKEIEKTTIKNNEVLVKVKAISINPVDVKVRCRKAPLAESLAQYNPLILGWDISGVVAENRK
jgi:NADPH:quinone reductase-like Zn-dependent oxidoreductase